MTMLTTIFTAIRRCKCSSVSLTCFLILCSHCSDRDVGRDTLHQMDDTGDTMDFDENLDQSFPDDEVRGDSQQVDPDGKATNTEQDEVFAFSLSIPALIICTRGL